MDMANMVDFQFSIAIDYSMLKGYDRCDTLSQVISCIWTRCATVPSCTELVCRQGKYIP